MPIHYPERISPRPHQIVFNWLKALRHHGGSASLNEDIINGRGGLPTVLRLAWPSLCEQIMVTMVQYVDTAMVSSLGAASMAAVGINMPMNWILHGAMMAVSVGATVTVARSVGAKKYENASTAARQAVVLGLLLGLFFTVFLLFTGGMIPRWLGAQPDYVNDACSYLRIFGLGLGPGFTGIILSGVLRGTGDTRTPMLANIVNNVVNVIGNFFLIYPSRDAVYFGFEVHVPGMGLGVAGAAAATAFSSMIAGAMLFVVLLHRKSNPAHFTLRQSFKPEKTVIRGILSIGIPTALERVTLSSGQLLFIRLVSSLGTVAVAAHQIAIVAESFCYMPTWGFSMAATTLVGQCLGAGRPDYARKHANTTLAAGVTTMTIAGIVLYCIPEFLMRFFSKDPEVVSIGASLLRIIAIGQPFTALMIVLTGALRGAGDTRWPFYISAIGMWGIRLCSAWFFIHIAGWGIQGAWYGMVTDLSIRGFLFLGRWRSGRWVKAMPASAKEP